MTASAPQLLDLREHIRPDLLAAFVDLYTCTFTDPSEREDPAQWPLRLYSDLPAPQPRMHLLVAIDDSSADTRLLGGVAFEYYRASRCGLLTYLVIDPAHRRRSLARQLIQRTLVLLQQDASEYGTVLRGVFSETKDPDQVGAHGNAMSPRERLTALARLGARLIDIPYVQPTLAGGSERCRHLLLLAFHPDSTQTDHIEGGAVRDFLHEFYRALGVDTPEADDDFRAMERSLAVTVALKAL